MAVRQLHYTSCEDGLEGIQGFQVSAMTPGAPRPLTELAVRASAYEVGPGLVGRLDDRDLSGFPIAFGYVASGDGAALFQSRYAGADFTGRMGNYFAHALLFDDVRRELGDVLPIDLWRSPAWTHTRVAGTALPELTSLAPGDETDPDGTRRFLGRRGATAALERVLGATQRALVSGRGRVVLVVPDDRSAALWLAATCRSLPRPLGLRVSFTTYTARPEESTALVSCTTPDVRLPTYGDFTAIDLTTDQPRDADSTRYASALAQLWDRDAVADALALAARADPDLTAAELDAFAVLLEMAFDLPVQAPADQALLLAAVRLAVDRMRRCLPAHAWERIADEVQDSGGPVDVAGWSEVLRTARHTGEPVPSKLFGAYFIAALRDRERLWLPQLTPADLDDVAENVVLPSLTETADPALVERVAEQRDLVDALVRVLERRLVDARETARLAAALPPDAARLLAGRGADRIKLLTDLVLARHGALDKVKVMVDARQADWRQLGPVLWPADPSTEDAIRLLRHVPEEVLVDSGLGTRIVAQSLDHAGRAKLSRDESRLLEALLRSPLSARLRPSDRDGLKAAESAAYFHDATPRPGSEAAVLTSIATAASLRNEVGGRLLASVASFMLRADHKLHRDLLDLALAEHGPVFLPAYKEAARGSLAAAKPHKVAGVVVAWRGLADPKTRDALVDDVLADALRKRRAKHLDGIGSSLQPMADVLGVAAPKPNWSKWWQEWRKRHERRGLLSLFRRGKG
ncbi:hypothetical protein F4560_007717 [Saccharothrix ecbatanensis]|uniref:Uncharacterized protein n=1 Tax=Saccharothrix ecbatanensis TaxID=1105145 RepID=A0A7W9HT29_9PSEU|nr:GTPase-associated protein 1-related protein [Saccharothrix ecbatanensis]MBB5807949.1 hypothetical protein [Saccharothrix ecbatanensis]